MNIETGREFSWPNPQDDPDMFPPPPAGFAYNAEVVLAASNDRNVCTKISHADSDSIVKCVETCSDVYGTL